MKCLTWNLEWKTPASAAGRLILEQVAAIDPDVVCYTENGTRLSDHVGVLASLGCC